MTETHGFVPPDPESLYARVHPDKISPAQLAEMKRHIAEQGVWEGRVTKFDEPTGAVEIVEPDHPGGLLKIMPGVVALPRNHPGRAPASPAPGVSRHKETAEAQRRGAKERLDGIDWNERSTPIYRPEDVNTAVPRSTGEFDTLLRIKAAEASLLERMKTAYVMQGRRDSPSLTPRLVRDPDEELLELIKSAEVPKGTYDAGYKSEALRGALNAQLEARELGPTEFTPADATGQEVSGYAIVDGLLVAPGARGPASTQHLVIFTTPSEIQAN